jgi:hypothetical protein
MVACDPALVTLNRILPAAPFIYFLQAIWPPQMSRVLCQDRLYCPRSTAGAGTERRALSTSWERLEGSHCGLILPVRSHSLPPSPRAVRR